MGSKANINIYDINMGAPMKPMIAPSVTALASYARAIYGDADIIRRLVSFMMNFDIYDCIGMMKDGVYDICHISTTKYK